MKNFIKDTSALVLAGAVFASGLCVFAAPNQILTGGAAGLAAARCSGGVSGFTAGSVSVQLRAEAERDAEGLRQTAERLMAPYAKAADFCFRRVRG